MSLSPEIIFAMALQDWLWSRESVRKFRSSEAKGCTVDMAQSLPNAVVSTNSDSMVTSIRTMPKVVLMRYCLIHPSSAARVDRPCREWTKVHAHYANMYVTSSDFARHTISRYSFYRGGYLIEFPRMKRRSSEILRKSDEDTSEINPIRNMDTGCSHPPVPFFAAQVLMLIEYFSFEIPHITPEDIQDRSKADAFTKLFAIGQST